MEMIAIASDLNFGMIMNPELSVIDYQKPRLSKGFSYNL